MKATLFLNFVLHIFSILKLLWKIITFMRPFCFLLFRSFPRLLFSCLIFFLLLNTSLLYLEASSCFSSFLAFKSYSFPSWNLLYCQKKICPWVLFFREDLPCNQTVQKANSHVQVRPHVNTCCNLSYGSEHHHLIKITTQNVKLKKMEEWSVSLIGDTLNKFKNYIKENLAGCKWSRASLNTMYRETLIHHFQ